MLFLIELNHVTSGTPLAPETGRAFIEHIIFPTLARAEEHLKAHKILAGGAVLGRVSLRFIVEADSLANVDQLLTSLPIWPLADTRVTPLLAFAERRQHAQALLESLQTRS